INGVHDVSDGGIAVTLAEMAINGECGARVTIPGEMCFAEPASVFVCSVAPEHVDDVVARGGHVVGQATAGDRLIVENAIDVAVVDARDVWRNAIPNLMSSNSW